MVLGYFLLLMINTLNKIIPFVTKDNKDFEIKGVEDFDKFIFGIFNGKDFDDFSVNIQDKRFFNMVGIEDKSANDVGANLSNNEMANFLMGINFLGDDGLKPLHVPDDDLVSKKKRRIN